MNEIREIFDIIFLRTAKVNLRKVYTLKVYD